MTTTDTADRSQDTAPADEDLVTGSIGWMAFLHADVIPIAAWEND